MKRILIGCFVVCLCAAVGRGQVEDKKAEPKKGRTTARGGPEPRGGPAHPQWEYLVKSRPDIEKTGEGSLPAGLNKLGEEGWELVSAEPAQATGRSQEYIFKRSKGGLPRGMMGGLGGFPGGMAGPDFGGGRRAAPEAEQIHILNLKHAQAGAIAQLLQQVYTQRRNVGVGIDDRTNSLILVTTDEHFQAIKRLVDELDRRLEKDKKENPQGKDKQENP
jgi:hypothetical protein